jgi:hypothetical protein
LCSDQFETGWGGYDNCHADHWPQVAAYVEAV